MSIAPNKAIRLPTWGRWALPIQDVLQLASLNRLRVRAQDDGCSSGHCAGVWWASVLISTRSEWVPERVCVGLPWPVWLLQWDCEDLLFVRLNRCCAACSVQCLSDGDCGSNDFCIVGACAPKAGNGVPCVSVRSAQQFATLSCTHRGASCPLDSSSYRRRTITKCSMPLRLLVLSTHTAVCCSAGQPMRLQ